MLKRVLPLLVVAVLLVSGFVAVTPAAASENQHHYVFVCVKYENGKWYPVKVEKEDLYKFLKKYQGSFEIDRWHPCPPPPPPPQVAPVVETQPQSCNAVSTNPDLIKAIGRRVRYYDGTSELQFQFPTYVESALSNGQAAAKVSFVFYSQDGKNQGSAWTAYIGHWIKVVVEGGGPVWYWTPVPYPGTGNFWYCDWHN